MRILRPWAVVVALVCLLAVATAAHAQSRFAALVTDRDLPPLPATFAVPGDPLVNQAGDYAFTSYNGRSLFLLRAGSTSLVRVIQTGDEVPGVPGSLVGAVSGAAINSSGDVFFGAYYQSPAGRTQSGIFKFNGTVVSAVIFGTDPVPGIPGATFERSIALVRANDNGDILFSATMVPSGFDFTSSASYFILPAGGTAVRMIGVNDSAPGTGRAFTSIAVLGFNNRREVLFSGNLTGSPGFAYFLGTTAGVTKLVANGDTLSEVQLTANPSQALLNNAGQVVFLAEARIWMYAPGQGIAKIAAAGMPAPGDPFGPYAALTIVHSIRAFNDSGQIAFQCSLWGTTLPVGGAVLLRYPGTGGNLFDVIAYGGEAVSSTPPYTLDTRFWPVAMNDAGAVCFRSGLLAGGNPTGLTAIFTQEGPAPPVLVAKDGDPAPLPGGGTLSVATAGMTYIQGNGSVVFPAYVNGGVSIYGHFRSDGGALQPLVATEWPLPPGYRTFTETIKPAGDGDYVAFVAAPVGGPGSMLLHNVRTGTTTRVASELEPVPPGGPRTEGFIWPLAVPVNRNGTMVIHAWEPGSVSPWPTSIVLRRVDGTMTVLASVGAPVPGAAGQVFSSLALSSFPPPLNRSDQVVFFGNWGSSGRGFFIGSPDGPAQKIAAVGDSSPNGSTFASFVGHTAVMLNNAGQVAFVATTSNNARGVYFWSQAGGLVKIAQNGDPSPAGGTFSTVGQPALAQSGNVLFMATSGSGGPRGGVFLWSSATGSIEAVAVDGAPAPDGGTFAIDHVRPDLALNEAGDLAFRSWLAGGTSDSGIFVRRHGGGGLQRVAAQGVPAPGTGSVYSTIASSTNTLVGEFIQMDEDGNIAFLSSVVGPNTFQNGVWRVDPSNRVELIRLYGGPAPDLGGGSVYHLGNGGTWIGNGRWIGTLRMSGGTFDDGIGIWTAATGVPTPVGTNVTVQVPDLVTGASTITATFDTVLQAGTSSAMMSVAGGAMPSAFNVGTPPQWFELSTTALFAGNVNLCFDISGVTYGPGDTPRLLHYTGGVWLDITTSSSSAQVCGVTSSFSFFAVAQVPQAATLRANPSVIWPPNNKMVRVDIGIDPGDPAAGAARLALLSVTANEPLGPSDIQGAIVGADCRRIQVRASRLGSGNGRVYTFTYKVTHEAGFAVVRSVEVRVPHDQGK